MTTTQILLILLSLSNLGLCGVAWWQGHTILRLRQQLRECGERLQEATGDDHVEYGRD